MRLDDFDERITDLQMIVDEQEMVISELTEKLEQANSFGQGSSPAFIYPGQHLGGLQQQQLMQHQQQLSQQQSQYNHPVFTFAASTSTGTISTGTITVSAKPSEDGNTLSPGVDRYWRDRAEAEERERVEKLHRAKNTFIRKWWDAFFRKVIND